MRLGPPSADDRWQTYLSAVEPELGSHVRLHRFAQPPVIGGPGTYPLPLTVWIEGDGAPARATRDALATATAKPAAVLQGTLGEALAATRSDYVALIRAGDVLAPLALERLGQAVTLAPDAAVITCDDDELDSDGARRRPRFRPGPSPDRWLACDDSGALQVVSRRPAQRLLSALDGGQAWRHELALALGGPGAECHAHVPLLLCHRAADRAMLPSLSADTAARVLRRWEPAARVEASDDGRRARRPVAGEPSVEIVTCFRDRPELTQRCVESVLTRTRYQRLRLALVDNGSVEAETASLLARLAQDPRVRILRDPRQFNFAALNNAAAAGSDADVLVFLNNDTEVVDGGWVETLLEEAVRPQVGAVAPMLLFPDDTVQHAGAALGLHGYAGHPFAGLTPRARTPFGHAAQGTRNWMAVTAACLMVQRDKFTAVGGFDESFVVAGNDVDLGLRLTARGHRSLCVPHTHLLHDESRSRGQHIDPGDFTASERSYGEFRTVGDPFYNPNLTLRRTDCSVRGPDG